MLYYTEDRLFRTIHPLLAEPWIHFRLKDIKSGFNDYDNKADSEAAKNRYENMCKKFPFIEKYI